MDAPSPLPPAPPAQLPYKVSKDGQSVKFGEKTFYVTIYQHGRPIAHKQSSKDQLVLKTLVAQCAQIMFDKLGDDLKQKDASAEFTFNGKSHCSLKAPGREEPLEQQEALRISSLLSRAMHFDIQPKEPLCATFKRVRGEYTCYANAFLHTIFQIFDKPLPEPHRLEADANAVEQARVKAYSKLLAIQQRYLDLAKPTIEAVEVKKLLSVLQELKECLEEKSVETAAQLNWSDVAIQHDPAELFDFFFSHVLFKIGGEILNSLQPLKSGDGADQDGAPYIILPMADKPKAEQLSVKGLFEAKTNSQGVTGKRAFEQLARDKIPPLLPISLDRNKLDGTKATTSVNIDQRMTLQLQDGSYAIYALTTAMCHEGPRIDGGHFTTVKFVAESKGETWAHCDDENVKECFTHELFGKDGVMAKQASFLLYYLTEIIKPEPPPALVPPEPPAPPPLEDPPQG